MAITPKIGTNPPMKPKTEDPIKLNIKTGTKAKGEKRTQQFFCARIRKT